MVAVAGEKEAAAGMAGGEMVRGTAEVEAGKPSTKVGNWPQEEEAGKAEEEMAVGVEVVVVITAATVLSLARILLPATAMPEQRMEPKRPARPCALAS